MEGSWKRVTMPFYLLIRIVGGKDQWIVRTLLTR
jgi:hypothetical protein